MSIDKSKYCGFTLIELITVIAILSILATIAVVSYRRYGLQRYDSEAYAHMASLYEQTASLVNDWGLVNSGTDGVDGIRAACRLIGPDDAGVEGASCNANSLNANNTLHLTLTGTSHWRFKVCTGYVDNSQTEGVIVSAHRLIDGNERVLILGAGMSSPIVANEGTSLSYSTSTSGSGSTMTSKFKPPVNLASSAGSDGDLWTSWYF